MSFISLKVNEKNETYFSKFLSIKLCFTIFIQNLLKVGLTDFINERLSVEEYAFTWEELVQETEGKSKIAIRSELYYAINNGKVISLRHKFYLIIPPRYSRMEKLPVELYIDKLFEFLNRNYYLGLYSAARFYGSGHQQIQKEYILHDKSSLLPISKGAFKLDFFTVSNWPKKNILSRKADAGLFKISSPSLTAVDLLYHQTKIGGLNRTLSILEELVEEVKLSDVSDLLSWYSQKSVLQRFGFLLNENDPHSEPAELIFNHLSKQKFFPVLLSPKSNQKAGAVDNRWKVDVNVKMESDL